MVIEFCPENHTYKLNGNPVPNVTSIIQNVMGVGWRADEWYLQRGTAVHHAARLLIEGRLDWATVDERIVGRVRAAEKFLKDFHLDAGQVEVRLASEHFLFAGTADVIAHGCVYDWKGSIDPRVELQLGAYAIAAEEMLGIKPPTGMVIELHDDGNYKTETYHKMAVGRNLFLAALTVYGFKQKHNLKETN